MDSSDDEFFNNPELHARLDQVEHQFRITQTHAHDQRPTKKLKTIELKHQIDQITKSLQLAEQDKINLNGQVAIIRSQLDSEKHNNHQQLNQLEKLHQHYKSRAERAEQKLTSLEHLSTLKETFKAFDQSTKKLKSPSSSLLTTSKTTKSTDNPFPPHPTKSIVNHFQQSTLPSPPTQPRPSISIIEPHPSLTQSLPTSLNSLAAAPTYNPHHLIHSVITRLFLSFIVNLRPDPSLPGENPGDRLPRAPLLPSLHVILDAAHLLPRAHPNLKPAFDALIFELFTCLASAFHSDSLPPSSPSQHSSPDWPSNHPLGNINRDDALVMGFVARLGALFVQISSLLIRTDLIEAQTQVIHVLAILAQTSPLFTSFFLHHPDFEAYEESAPVQQQPDLLAVLLLHFELLHRTRPVHNPSGPSFSADSFLQTPLPQPPKVHSGLTNETSSLPPISLLILPLHFALLDLIDALIWDPPEACYPTWEKFLKSNGQPFLQFLLVGPQQATGVPENDDDLILTKKSMDVLLSLASKAGFSRIIMDVRVHESNSILPHSTPATSNPNGHPSQPQQQTKTLPPNAMTNRRPAGTPSTTLDPNKKTTQRAEGGTMTVVDRLMKIFLLAATNQDVDRPSSGHAKLDDPPGDTDRHQLKVKILSLIQLLAVTHHRQPTDDFGAEWSGWQAVAHAGSFIFSVLIKTTFVDSYRLWNVDGAVGHRLRIPQYIERIELSVEIIHKMIFSQSSPSSPSSRKPLNLISRLKQESPLFASALSTLSVPSSSSSPSSSSPSSSRPMLMVIGTHNNIYHEFIVSFAKLGWLDYLTPSSPSSYSFPWEPVQSHFRTLFNCRLPNHIFSKLGLIADLAYDVLSSIASPDELDDWKRCALDDISEDEESFD